MISPQKGRRMEGGAITRPTPPSLLSLKEGGNGTMNRSSTIGAYKPSGFLLLFECVDEILHYQCADYFQMVIKHFE